MMKQRVILWGAAAFYLACVSCNLQFRKNARRINALNEMQQTDVDFSNRSKETGMKQAFLEYMEPDGILLRPNRLPVTGADAVELISSLNDTSFMLTWEPLGADVAASADMGYTYGMYDLKAGDSVRQGTYVTIWKKQADGRWKFVLDADNEIVEKGINDTAKDSGQAPHEEEKD